MPEPQEKNTSTPQKDEKTVEKKVNVLEDDDEFEDFPADGIFTSLLIKNCKKKKLYYFFKI